MWYHDGPRALKKTKAQHSNVPTVAARTMCHHNRPMEIKAAPALYVVGENEIENYSSQSCTDFDVTIIRKLTHLKKKE